MVTILLAHFNTVVNAMVTFDTTRLSHVNLTTCSNLDIYLLYLENIFLQSGIGRVEAS